MRPEYNFSEGVRGKHYKVLRKGEGNEKHRVSAIENCGKEVKNDSSSNHTESTTSNLQADSAGSGKGGTTSQRGVARSGHGRCSGSSEPSQRTCAQPLAPKLGPYLNDAALWQAGRATMTAEQRERLEALHDKQQHEGLTPEEQAEEQALLSLYRETLLVRAQAAVLLKQRGYDVSEPLQFASLS